MRHSNQWPWHFAYAGCNTKTNKHETRWHGRGGADFGVRRPLRYLSHRLDLDESQTRKMATVLNALKTEREQARLDETRTNAALAELMAKGTPTQEEVKEVLEPRVKSTETLNTETARSVISISEFLDEDQRKEFINLLLTGSISL